MARPEHPALDTLEAHGLTVTKQAGGAWLAVAPNLEMVVNSAGTAPLSFEGSTAQDAYAGIIDMVDSGNGIRVKGTNTHLTL